MDQIIPEKVLKDKKTKKPSTPISAVPRAGKEIKLFVGESLDFTEKVKKEISWKSNFSATKLTENIV